MTYSRHGRISTHDFLANLVLSLKVKKNLKIGYHLVSYGQLFSVFLTQCTDNFTVMNSSNSIMQITRTLMPVFVTQQS